MTHFSDGWNNKDQTVGRPCALQKTTAAEQRDFKSSRAGGKWTMTISGGAIAKFLYFLAVEMPLGK